MDDWQVDHVAVGAVPLNGEPVVHGEREREFRWASVTKLLTAYAVLVAAEEGTIDLDEPAGPPGSTMRHLLVSRVGPAVRGRNADRSSRSEARVLEPGLRARCGGRRRACRDALRALSLRRGARAARARRRAARLPGSRCLWLARRPHAVRRGAPGAAVDRPGDAGRGDDRPVPRPGRRAFPTSGASIPTIGASASS